MDRGIKIYGLILGTICLSLIIIFLYETPKVKELNHQLQSNKEIKQFPYQFKVLRVNNGTATLNSPVSTELPCGKVIEIIFPSIRGKSLLSPEFQKAKNSLAKIQILLANMVKSDPEITKIIWELDRPWLIQNGVSLNNY